MKKTTLMLIIIAYAFFAPKQSYSFAQIYDEESGLVYIGGNPLEMKRFELDKLRPRLARKIFAINVKDNTSKLINEITSPIYMYEVNNKGYVAVSVVVKDGDAEKTALIIYDGKKGKKIKEIENVPALLEHKYFSWNNDGNKIAYVTGVNTPESGDPFRPKGAWIYDVEQDKAIQISQKGVQVNWSRHDNNLYLQGVFGDTQFVSMYNIATGELTKIDKKGLIFSDDGKYCIGYESKWEKVQINKKLIDKTMVRYYIYDSTTNKPYYQFKIGKNFGQEEWAGDAKFIPGSHNLLMWDYLGGHRIFDVDNKKFLRVSATSMLGWNQGMTKIVVYEKGGKQVHIEDLMTGKRLQSINIPE